MKEVYIIASKRTPLGAFKGSLSKVQTTELGSIALKAAINQSRINPKEINEVYMGCVLTAGLGQSPARQTTLKAGIPYNTPATTINKVCGSGMKAIMIAVESLQNRNKNIIVAGGMENMSNAPYLLPKIRFGYKLGHKQIFDHLMLDGLEDAYDKGLSMGFFAEKTAEKYSFSREEQDKFAEQSIIKAHKAQKKKYFLREIVPIIIKNNKNNMKCDEDELPSLDKLKKISSLLPAFKKNGTVTAANASSINDGAAVVILTNKKTIKQKGLHPLATIIACSTFATKPEQFTTAPIQAIKKVIKKAKWDLNSVDAFEINEAFAVVPMATIKELSIEKEKVNIFGGACALGHPIGASGTRIIVTLINILNQIKGKRGIASICIGGGEATAIALEVNSKF